MTYRKWWLPFIGLWLVSIGGFTGCSSRDGSNSTGPKNPQAALPDLQKSDSSNNSAASASPSPQKVATAKTEDVTAAKQRLESIGPTAKFTISAGRLSGIVIQDGSVLNTDDFTLFGRLTDLEKLQIYNCRALNNEMASQLSGLKELTTLAMTNTVISDAAVETIVKSFPNLTDLDLSSNTNMTTDALKTISDLNQLQRLTLIQNRFNDLSTRRLSKLQDLRALDLRGNMEAGDMTLEVVAGLPKLTAFKHRSTAVSDYGMEHLSRSATIENLLIQDFVITSQSGPYLAKLGKLTQLEIFRCQGFGSEGVLALKGLSLQRLTLRDLPNVDDQALEVLTELPKLRRLYLHEIESLSDSGLEYLEALQSLELLDIWSVPQMTDAAIDVIAALPNLKELGVRSTSVTDAAIDKLLAMEKLQSLTFKENGAVTANGLAKLSTKKWLKLDTGSSENAESDTQ